MPGVSLGIRIYNMNKEDTIFNISPLDGRYRENLEDLGVIFSEYGLMKARFIIEINFFLALSKAGVMLRKISPKEISYLNSLIKKFSVKDFDEIKEKSKTAATPVEVGVESNEEKEES